MAPKCRTINYNVKVNYNFYTSQWCTILRSTSETTFNCIPTLVVRMCIRLMFESTEVIVLYYYTCVMTDFILCCL